VPSALLASETPDWIGEPSWWQELVDDVNRDRTRVEQIKRFVILPRDFSQEEGEVTPTLKLRRNVIHEHFADEIEQLYASGTG